MNFIFGPNTSIIGPDGKAVPGGVRKSMENSNVIDVACFKTFSGPGPILIGGAGN
jgi:hypothetical protein